MASHAPTTSRETTKSMTRCGGVAVARFGATTKLPADRTNKTAVLQLALGPPGIVGGAPFAFGGLYGVDGVRAPGNSLCNCSSIKKMVSSLGGKHSSCHWRRAAHKCEDKLARSPATTFVRMSRFTGDCPGAKAAACCTRTSPSLILSAVASM